MAKYFTKPPLGTPLNPAHPLNRGLVLYMPFSEGAGSKTQDLSGKGNHGTLTNMVQGATSGWSSGKFGGAMNFDGVDDIVAVGNPEILKITGTITLAVWLKTEKVTNDAIIGREFATVTAPFFDYLLFKENGFLHYRLGASFHTGTIKINDGKWHLLVGTYNFSNMISYVDGILDKSTAKTDNITTTGVKVIIGSWTGVNFFNGLMSEVRIYNRALSEQEIKQLYTDPFCMYESKGISRWAQLIKKGSFFFR